MHIENLARALFVGACLAFGAAEAQSTATLEIVSGSEIPGATPTIGVLAQCTSPIDGVSFGIAHDASVLSIVAAGEGAAFEITPPDFIDVSTSPVGGPGLTVGLIVNFALVVRLDPLVSHEVLAVTYSIDPGALSPLTTPLTLVGNLGSPPVQAIVVSGLLEFTPALSDGVIEILTDCNGNLVADAIDLAVGTSADCDLSGVPDECELLAGGSDINGDGQLDLCEVHFRRGDCNASGAFTLADPYSILQHLFITPTITGCPAACDSNGDCALDLFDAIHSLQFLFAGGFSPPEPFLECGIDSNGCGVHCASFGPCP